MLVPGFLTPFFAMILSWLLGARNESVVGLGRGIVLGLSKRLDSYRPLQALFPLSRNVALNSLKRVTTCP